MIPSGITQRDERKQTADDVSKAYRRCRNRGEVVAPGQVVTPDCCPDGIRHEGGVTLGLARARNVGTCRPDAKGEAQMGCPHESGGPDAGHRDGAARSRNEGSVMESDRRGCVVRLWREVNQQWEEPRG